MYNVSIVEVCSNYFWLTLCFINIDTDFSTVELSGRGDGHYRVACPVPLAGVVVFTIHYYNDECARAQNISVGGSNGFGVVSYVVCLEFWENPKTCHRARIK